VHEARAAREQRAARQAKAVGGEVEMAASPPASGSGSSGRDGDLKARSPPAASTTTTSVKVPPTSTPIRMPLPSSAAAMPPSSRSPA